MSINPVTTGVSPAWSMTAASPTTAATGATGTAKTHWHSDPTQEDFAWQALERLTPSDRALIKAVTGQDIPTRDSGLPPNAPPLALEISADRQAGILSEGKVVDADYIKGLIAKYADQKPHPFGSAAGSLDLALKHLIDNPPTSTVDVRA